MSPAAVAHIPLPKTASVPRTDEFAPMAVPKVVPIETQTRSNGRPIEILVVFKAAADSGQGPLI